MWGASYYRMGWQLSCVLLACGWGAIRTTVLIPACGSVSQSASAKGMNDNLYFPVYLSKAVVIKTHERLTQTCPHWMWAVWRLIILTILRFKTNHLAKLENNKPDGLPLLGFVSFALLGKGDYVLIIIMWLCFLNSILILLLKRHHL